MQKPGVNQDLILEDGDIIRGQKQAQIFHVNVEILYPSAVVFERLHKN